MKEPIAYEDAVDVLDADHNAVKKMFIDYGALIEDDATSPAKRDLAHRICQALTIHAQLEEELFYPEVRAAIGDDALMDEALAEHGQAKQLIASIQSMNAADASYDATVKKLGTLIDEHVLEEREQIFLKARYAALDLRTMTLPLLKRQQQLKKTKPAAAAKEAS